MTSRSYNSTNWRQKASEGTQNQRTNPPPTASYKNDDSPAPPQSIAEGRRLYIGNMPYMAKTEDIKALFTNNGYEV